MALSAATIGEESKDRTIGKIRGSSHFEVVLSGIVRSALRKAQRAFAADDDSSPTPARGPYHNSALSRLARAMSSCGKRFRECPTRPKGEYLRSKESGQRERIQTSRSRTGHGAARVGACALWRQRRPLERSYG